MPLRCGAILISLLAELGACTPWEIGQTLYNVGKEYCAQNTDRCDDAGFRPQHERPR